jgi:hypothetical protein
MRASVASIRGHYIYRRREEEEEFSGMTKCGRESGVPNTKRNGSPRGASGFWRVRQPEHGHSPPVCDRDFEDGFSPSPGQRPICLQSLGSCTPQPAVVVPPVPAHSVSQGAAKRLGLIGKKVTAENAHALLQALLPQDARSIYNFHKALLRHGQRICVFERPRCNKCPITDLCDYYHTVVKPQ